MSLAPLELPDDKYVWHIQVFLAFDCLCNALLRGWHHETLSSRCWRAWQDGKRIGLAMRKPIDALFVWQAWDMRHCCRAYLKELERARRVIALKRPEPTENV